MLTEAASDFGFCRWRRGRHDRRKSSQDILGDFFASEENEESITREKKKKKNPHWVCILGLLYAG